MVTWAAARFGDELAMTMTDTDVSISFVRSTLRSDTSQPVFLRAREAKGPPFALPTRDVDTHGVPPTVELKPDDLWTIAYTSGTTGQPKGAILREPC